MPSQLHVRRKQVLPRLVTANWARMKHRLYLEGHMQMFVFPTSTHRTGNKKRLCFEGTSGNAKPVRYMMGGDPANSANSTLPTFPSDILRKLFCPVMYISSISHLGLSRTLSCLLGSKSNCPYRTVGYLWNHTSRPRAAPPLQHPSRPC